MQEYYELVEQALNVEGLSSRWVVGRVCPQGRLISMHSTATVDNVNWGKAWLLRHALKSTAVVTMGS